MDLRNQFNSIVMGTMVLGTGCPSTQCLNEAQPVAATVSMGENSPELDEAIANDLLAFETANPTASANEKLEYLFGRPDTPWNHQTFNATLKGIVDDAVATGGISQRACEAICGGTSLKRVMSCHTPGESVDEVVVCVGALGGFCGGAGRRPAGLLAEHGTEGSPEGQWWAHIAYLEKAAVHAFI